MRRRLGSQEGVALTVAIFTLAMIALFSALVASTAGQLSGTSNESRDSKRALGAAEAGINTALHRVNNWGTVQNLECFTDIAFTPTLDTAYTDEIGGIPVDTGPGNCPPAKGRAGNSGEWAYWITLLNNGGHCDQQYTTQTQVNQFLTVAVGGISVLRRCITSMGVVNGVSRRIQREIYSEFTLFNGLIATGGVLTQSGTNVTGHVGSNTSVTMQPGSVFNGQIELLEGVNVDNIDATGQWGVQYRPKPWIHEPVEVAGSMANTGQINCVLPLLLCSQWDGLPSHRKLKVDTGETVTITSGDQRLCGLNMNGGTLQVSGTARLFIDDDCPNGAPGFEFNGGLLNTAGLAANLQIYAESGNPISIEGGTLVAEAHMSLFAPAATVTLEKGGGLIAPVVEGNIAAHDIVVRGLLTTFVGEPLLNIATPFEQIGGKWYAGDWSECRSEQTVDGDPHSGCNG